MSIAPPSDIVLDVAQAADPLKLQAATSRLAKMAAEGGAAGDGFSAALTISTPAAATPASLSMAFSPPRIVTRQASPYEKFEAVMLQNFLQNILPKDAELFGDAASADACRSMLAEQLADQLAKTGKIGIAQKIEAAHGPGHPGDVGAAARQASSWVEDLGSSSPVKAD